MNRQKLITILATIAIIATLTVSLFYPFGSATATTYNADNVTVEGVLYTDNYVLYPFAKDNLTIGISKYGELINGAATPAVGLEYKGMDVFANSHVLESDWSQGWFIDIHYADKSNNYKNVWAFAMYSDLSGTGGIGGPWQEGCTDGTLGAPHGGRKTNAYATTDPIQILYDGPRRFVALTHTIIYEDSAKTKALVGVTITFVFDKVKKCVILYKDIKRLDLGKWGRTFQVEFSNRGEWDIGITSAPPSYAHFYDNLTTVYDYEYHDFYSATHDTEFDAVQMIDEGGSYVGFAAFWPRLFGKLVSGTNVVTETTVLSSLCTKVYNETWATLTPTGSPARIITFATEGWPTADSYPRGAGLWNDAPMVFKNGILMTDPADYGWNGATDVITFTSTPADTDYITVVYKHQAPDGGGADDMADHTTEPKTPYVIGEWCFDLEDADYRRQFRAVTMYGLTDRHDADDDNADAETWQDVDANVIDCEVQYYLNETFNPYDLYDAVHKQESRWLYYDDSLTAATSYITLTDGLDDQLYYAVMSSEYTAAGLLVPGWTGYFIREDDTSSAESEWVNEFEDSIDAHSKNWALLLNGTEAEVGTPEYEMLKVTPIAGTPTSTAPLTLQLKDLVDFDFWYNMSSGTQGPHIEIKVYNSSAGGETGNKWANIAARVDNNVVAAGWHHYTLNTIEDFIGGWTSDSAFQLTGESGTGLSTGEFHSFEYWTSKLGAYYVGSVGVQIQLGHEAYVDDISVGYLNKASGIRYERVYNMEEDKLIPSDWDAYCSFAERVLIDGVLIDRYPYHLLRNYVEGGHAPYYTINFENGTINFHHYVTGYTTWTLPIGTHIKVLYSTIEENEKGRYEWMVVGKDAATVDAIGAAYMTEAFDSIKDIHVQVTALDINETAAHGAYVPFVMGGAVTSTKADYRDTLGRTFLRDDWCTTYPVASSNMLFAGGPGANLGAEYFNEFTMAFFARTEYVVNDTGQANEIFALSCWNKYSYGSGYAVVSVYKDLNGTIGFLIWGMDGQDTYYAAKWFWDEGIEYLQTENRGVTDIILEIDYTTCPYSASITDERLGTISEKACHDCP